MKYRFAAPAVAHFAAVASAIAGGQTQPQTLHHPTCIGGPHFFTGGTHAACVHPDSGRDAPGKSGSGVQELLHGRAQAVARLPPAKRLPACTLS